MATQYSAPSYKKLAVSWLPDNTDNRLYYTITAIVLSVLLVLAVIISIIDVPPKERAERRAVPERVAKFITQKKKPEVVAPKPTPTPLPKPRPTPSPKPKVVREKQLEAEKRKPLTVEEKKARETAENSGLLALGSELADLIDTSDVAQQVGAKTKKNVAGAEKSLAVNTDVLTSGTTTGSGGVRGSSYLGEVGSTQLAARDVALITQTLVDTEAQEKTKSDSSSVSRERTGNVRSEEEVTMVFDQNKGQLYSIYNRERRKKPGLKGKLVLEITISPEGNVTSARIASSELNDPGLERRILARVKRFKFAPGSVEPVTVTFPIEFLPS